MKRDEKMSISKKEIIEIWNTDKNIDFSPNDAGMNDSKKVWWKCSKCNYEWVARIDSVARAINRGAIVCPCCAGKNITDELLSEWDWEKNHIHPSECSKGSSKVVWWHCSKCGEEWKASINGRSRGSGCPVCSKISRANKRHAAAIKDINNTIASRTELVKEWNYSKNTDVTPRDVSLNSTKKVWWICNSCGFEWSALPSNRNKGSGCPACANQILWPGHNDLKTMYPDLATEWNYEKNDEKRPEDFIAGGHTKVWWTCSKCGSDWKTSIRLRVSGRGCPKCKFSLHTSLPEQIIYFYVKNTFPDAINSYKPDFLNGKEIDIYIPSINVGIEYDGAGWHYDIEKDIEKTNTLLEHKIDFIRIREPKCPKLIDGSYRVDTGKPDGSYSHLEKAIELLSDYVNQKYHVVIKREKRVSDIYLDILKSIAEKQRKNSLAIVRPSLLAEWDKEKNYGLSPDQVLANSNISVWWRCKTCNHSWKANVDRRVRGAGCPRCAGEVVWPGKNDFETVCPDLLHLWNYKRNQIKPDSIMDKSHKKVWWKCPKCEHEWTAPLYSISDGHGCPVCANQAVKTGYNDLTTTSPAIASEWNAEKNLPLKPTDVTAGSKRKVWWKCITCGYEWQAVISSRAKNGRGCPACANRAVHYGYNDLETQRPDIALEWDSKKNEKKASEYVVGSNASAWWKCKSCGYEWKSKIVSRTNGSGCPSCAHTLAWEGHTDLQTVNPELASQWDDRKNGELKATMVLPKSTKKVWWICPNCNNNYKASVRDRTNGKRCPKCNK